MNRLWKVCGIVCLGLLLAAPASLLADPCLVVYPTCQCIYRYDPMEYYTVGPGHELYDPEYDRGGLVLLEIDTDEIDHTIYQAPLLMGFEVSTDGNEGFIFVGTDFDLVLRGWSDTPTTFVNVLLVFDRILPDGCIPTVTVDGMPLVYDNGYVYAAGDLVISTPVHNGYSDTIVAWITWAGCYGVRMWAFSDENYNGVLDGGECFTAFSHDATIPTESSSWGAIKALFETR